MSEAEERVYWTWREDLGGGYEETFILYLYADRVEFVAHVDYRGSRPARRWTLAEARAEGRGAFDRIPDDVWEAFRARLG